MLPHKSIHKAFYEAKPCYLQFALNYQTEALTGAQKHCEKP